MCFCKQWLAAVMVVSLVSGSAFAWPYSPPNDFTNGDFETGGLDGWSWSCNRNSMIEVFQSDHDYYVHLFSEPELFDPPEPSMPPMPFYECRLWQTVLVPPEATSLVFDYTLGGDFSVEMRVEGSTIYSHWWSDRVGPGGWHTVDVVLPEQSRGNYTEFRFDVQGRSYYAILGGQVAFDNIRLIPEPAALSLLALGGLALIRRRHGA